MIKNTAISLLTLAIVALGAMAIAQSSRDEEQAQVRIEALRAEDRAGTEFRLLFRRYGELEEQIEPRRKFLSDDTEKGVWKRSEWLDLPIEPTTAATGQQILESEWITHLVYFESGTSLEGEPYRFLSTVSGNVDSIPGTRLEISCEAGEIAVAVWWLVLEHQRESDLLGTFIENRRGEIGQRFSHQMERIDEPRIEAGGIYYGWASKSPGAFIQDLQEHLELDGGHARIDMIHENRRQHLQAWFNLDLVAEEHLARLEKCGNGSD